MGLIYKFVYLIGCLIGFVKKFFYKIFGVELTDKIFKYALIGGIIYFIFSHPYIILYSITFVIIETLMRITAPYSLSRYLDGSLDDDFNRKLLDIRGMGPMTLYKIWDNIMNNFVINNLEPKNKIKG